MYNKSDGGKRMKKVGILTLYGNNNYGNKLQNYAVQEVLKKKNIEVETIINESDFVGINVFKQKIKDIIKKFLKTPNIQRYNHFMLFDKYINYSKRHIDKNHIPANLSNKYDCLFTGSDQVWNPSNLVHISANDFLTFAPREKRNSFSASFGVSEIPENMKEFYKENLNNLNHISVREDRGKEIIKELTGREDVEVLIDPTMLLMPEEWDKVSKKPKQLNTDKYILNYFLGNLSEERKNEINRIARENNCQVINILEFNDPFYATGPSEFLYLEKNAFLICTDSFHSCVFSILYNRPFVVFDREDNLAKMNSRIDTLLKKFNLKNRRFEGKITKENLNHDYTEAYEILENEREKADLFLKNALEIENNEEK